MKVLVIPDIHLKPWIFIRAAELMRKGTADRAVCLMDIADDWNLEMNLLLYELSYDTAIAFAREFPDTLWCLGNHDTTYCSATAESTTICPEKCQVQGLQQHLESCRSCQCSGVSGDVAGFLPDRHSGVFADRHKDLALLRRARRSAVSSVLKIRLFR